MNQFHWQSLIMTTLIRSFFSGGGSCAAASKFRASLRGWLGFKSPRLPDV
jgi:hypothetical protein